jgi:hypothetical protein
MRKSLTLMMRCLLILPLAVGLSGSASGTRSCGDTAEVVSLAPLGLTVLEKTVDVLTVNRAAGRVTRRVRTKYGLGNLEFELSEVVHEDRAITAKQAERLGARAEQSRLEYHAQIDRFMDFVIGNYRERRSWKEETLTKFRKQAIDYSERSAWISVYRAGQPDAPPIGVMRLIGAQYTRALVRKTGRDGGSSSRSYEALRSVELDAFLAAALEGQALPAGAAEFLPLEPTFDTVMPSPIALSTPPAGYSRVSGGVKTEVVAVGELRRFEPGCFVVDPSVRGEERGRVLATLLVNLYGFALKQAAYDPARYDNVVFYTYVDKFSEKLYGLLGLKAAESEPMVAGGKKISLDDFYDNPNVEGWRIISFGMKELAELVKHPEAVRRILGDDPGLCTRLFESVLHLDADLGRVAAEFERPLP